MTQIAWRVGIVAAAAALLLAGCGSGQHPDSAACQAAMHQQMQSAITTATTTPSPTRPAACAGVSDSDVQKYAGEAISAAASSAFSSMTADTTDDPTTTEDEATTSDAPAAVPADFKLSAKIVSQDCFSSAGCLMTYKVHVDKAPPGSYDVTYEVTVPGDQNGPSTNTISVTDGQTGDLFPDSAQPAHRVKSASKIKVTVTGVEAQ